MTNHEHSSSTFIRKDIRNQSSDINGKPAPVYLNEAGQQIYASGTRSPYDIEALNILKDKQFLAMILKDCTTEFNGMGIHDIIPYIENPSVGIVPVNPGLTNSIISGMPTESKIIGEGLRTFDIRFFARNPAVTYNDIHRGINVRILVDIEMQNSDKPGYDLVPRGVLYTGRMLSEQVGRDIHGDDYDALQKVYSIWICLNCPPSRSNTIVRYSFKQDILHGKMDKSLQSRYDLAQVILIRLPKESERDKAINKPTELMELLSTVYAREITPDAKLQELANMGIKVTDEVGERINTMCNLSEGIFEEGLEKGLEEAERQRIIAEEQRTRADMQQAIAEEQRNRADMQQAIAEEQRTRADVQQAIAEELQVKNDKLSKAAADAQAEVLRLKEQLSRLKAEKN